VRPIPMALAATTPSATATSERRNSRARARHAPARRFNRTRSYAVGGCWTVSCYRNGPFVSSGQLGSTSCISFRCRTGTDRCGRP
jgi:hypothetical protein